MVIHVIHSDSFCAGVASIPNSKIYVNKILYTNIFFDFEEGVHHHT